MFDFKRLISKYAKTWPILKSLGDGYHDYSNGGVWVDGDEVLTEFEGAVLPLGDKLIYDNNAYTTEDRKLYTYASNIFNNQLILFKGVEYTTMELKDYADYDKGLKVFILKRGANND